ncbi:hypothetical protein AB945B12_00243 [Acinetobacter baumannii]|nr:hypothetical protein AB945B12_00243 [Acinetobacter baumannii]
MCTNARISQKGKTMNAPSIHTTFVMNKIINIKQVIEFTGLSRATIYSLLDPKSDYYDPTFPKQIRLTKNRVAWSALEINEWIESKLAQR